MATHEPSCSVEPHRPVRPGAITVLLQELAAAPGRTSDGWAGSLRAGARVGRFELVRELGAGGFGTVWEARDLELGRSVAFKAVRAGGEVVCEERNLLEAEAAAHLSHPNIVTLFDAGRAEQGPFLVLELLKGQTLEQRLRRGALPVRAALRVAIGIARALAHAHAQGVVHRDVKPANVFLCDDGSVKVLDFGLARAFGRRAPQGGTNGYMAPEQISGGNEDERADVYSLGVTLHEMLTGELPSSSGAERVRRATHQRALHALVGEMLEREVARRPRDGAAALRALEREAAREPGRRWRALAVAAVAVAGAGVAYFAVPRGDAARAGSERRAVALTDLANDKPTLSLDALRHYFEALRLDDQYDWDRMQAELLAALREDPAFALAHLRLATTSLYYAAPIEGVDAARHLRAAREHADRLPEHDRWIVAAELAWLGDHPDEAEDLYERAVRRRPDDKRALLRLAWIRSTRETFAAGLPFAERALALDPSWAPAQDYVAIALVFRGDHRRALDLARGWAERWPSALTSGILNGVLLHMGDPDGALPVARRAVELWGRQDLGTLPRTLIMLDEFVEAEREARDAWRRGTRFRRFGSLPIVLRYRGKRDEAARFARELARTGQLGPSLQVRAVLAAGDGDRATLRALASSSEAVPDPLGFAESMVLGGEPDAAAAVLATVTAKGVRFSGGSRVLLRGLIEAARARQRGDLDSARATLEDLRTRVEVPFARVAAYPLGEVCHAMGDDRCAVESFQEFGRYRLFSEESAWAYPRSIYLTALSQERLGLRSEARATVERLLAIWADADPDLALLAEARRLRARLSRP